MNIRIATIVLCLLDLLAWGLVAWGTFLSGSDQATAGLDRSAGLAVTVLFLATGAPALALVGLRRAPIAALALALAFPAALLAAFLVAVVAFR